MKKYVVTEELLTGIVKYLYLRPYQEVAGLIQAIQTASVEYKEPEPESGDRSLTKEKQDGPAD